MTNIINPPFYFLSNLSLLFALKILPLQMCTDFHHKSSESTPAFISAPIKTGSPSSSQDLTLDSLQTTAQQTLPIPPTHPSINLRHHFHNDIAL